MNAAALDSPLEALALNYLTYAFLTAVNNIWAWIAVLTAAVSFWRMRVLASPAAAEPIRRVQNVAETAASTAPQRMEGEPVAAPVRAACRVLEREGSTKMKFCLYYKEEAGDFSGEGDGGESDDCGGCEAVEWQAVDAWRGDWEGLVAMRMGDMGWYRWQDRTVLNGSVVRLWEGRRRIHEAAPAVGGGAAW